MKRVARLAKLVDVVGGKGFDLNLADGDLSTRIEEAGFLHLHAFKPIAAKRAGHDRGARENHLVEIRQAEVVKVLVAEQNDAGFITARHFERVGVDSARSFDLEGVMSDAGKLKIQKFHHAPPIRLLIAPPRRISLYSG